ncbi:MAG: N-acyl-D-amino-acid deacylase family protein [Candidatus Polarisedimenticolia bacterium]
MRVITTAALLLAAAAVMLPGHAGGGTRAALEAPGASKQPAASKHAPPAAPTTLIRGASLIDGTGAPARPADVRLQGDRIAAVGALEPLAGESVADARGLTLAPGFIDTHSHADDDLFSHPDALAAVSQGITTVVVGQDGGAPFPLAEIFRRLEAAPAAINVAAYAGHGTVRRRVMGDDFRRAATSAEVGAMERLLKEEMRAGALGLSTGLEYDPGIYSAPDEVVRLAVVARKHGGRYISHIRSEDRAFWKAVDEIIDIGRRARIPVQISHTKLAMKTHWGKAERLIGILDRARGEGVEITGDLYPYLYWQSTLTVLFPERNFEDLDVAALVLDEIAPADGLLLTDFDPEPSYVGKTVAEIAVLRGEPAPRTLVELIRASEALAKETGGDTESVIGTSMQEPDLERLMRWPHMNFCTDGSLDGSHPRGFGSYPRILGRYVRERRVLTLEEAIHRASGLAARHMGFEDRGFIQPGMKADLVLFDPATVIDHATPQSPHAVSDGVRRVWVNGAVVFEAGRPTSERPGQVLRRRKR